MRVFIGSSSRILLKEKSQPLTDDNLDKASVPVLVAKRLTELGADVKAWWDKDTIPHQSEFFKRIQYWARACDLGVFIHSREDALDSKAKANLFATNGNVTLEIGMFILSKGSSSVYIIPEVNTLGLTDLTDRNWQQYNFATQVDALLSELEKWYIEKKREADSSSFKEHHLYVNAKLHGKIMDDSTVASWGTRALYLGRAASTYWRRIEKDKRYHGVGYRKTLEKFIVNNLTYPLDNVISFGPGIGTTDKIVLSKLRKPSPWFIPIDINPHLAMEALTFLDDKDLINGEPTAIIDDFEDDVKPLRHLIRDKFNQAHHNTLFMLMGGTLSNLKVPEELLKSVAGWMDPQDRLLVDVFLKGPRWTVEADFDSREQLDGFTDILVNALRLKARVKSNYANGETCQRFRALTFEAQKDRVMEFVERAIDGDDGSVIFQTTGAKAELQGLTTELLRIKRYEEDSLLDLFEEANLDAYNASDPITLVEGILYKRVYLLKTLDAKTATTRTWTPILTLIDPLSKPPKPA